MTADMGLRTAGSAEPTPPRHRLEVELCYYPVSVAVDISLINRPVRGQR
jgi:hypothetical protein